MCADFFLPLQVDTELPDIFPSPFDVRPHPVAAQAAQLLQRRLTDLCSDGSECPHQFEQVDGGKMFGVLVVKNTEGVIGYLSGFSGMLGNRWQQDGFVPPVFDQSERDAMLHEGESNVAELTRKIEESEAEPGYLDAVETVQQHRTAAIRQLDAMKATLAKRKQQRRMLRQNDAVSDAELIELGRQSRNDKLEIKNLKRKLQVDGENPIARLSQLQNKIDALKKQRKSLSAKLQTDLFGGYKIVSSDGQSRILDELFESRLPPSGAGDCAATKLVHHANVFGFKPLALAEFWWGAAPIGGLREHGRFYPSCRSRCRVVLPFMLQGQTMSIPVHEQSVAFSDDHPQTLYEDRDIVVVEKPAGLLSVPGKALTDSVETRLKARYPEVTGVMLLHRLDQATSGVMIAAKNPRAYKSLQHQFQDRTISKHYVAVLDGVIERDEGVVELPLRIDIYDRPRQIVCHERGKSALTKYRVIKRQSNTTRISFYPHTGRTHQLRVHAAHPEGLNCPILGDELYGRPGDRLHLHAAQLTFKHPVTEQSMSFSSEVTF